MKRFVLAALVLGASCARKPEGSYAVMETSKGRMTARLFEDRAPGTVAHVRALCGRAKPYYDGLPFHRVVPGFLIQTGDKTGTGHGDAHLPVADEIRPDARFDRPGLLAMASWGPGTSQTQFFITLAPAADLDGRHTIFGELVEGLEVAKAIASVPRDTTDGADRPYDLPLLLSLRLTSSRP
ncbi:MAG: peptidylprolyl isomerase [Elusimicrobiota bacterium]